MSKLQPFEINWVASAGSALGAVSAAVLLSTLGAAGTLIGAALGSLIITVGGSIYTQSLQKTTAHVQSRLVGRESGPANTDTVLSPRVVESSDSASEEPPRMSLRNLPWKRLIAVTIGLFVAVMAVILVFELATGRPVSSFTGGTSNTDRSTTISELGRSRGVAEDPEAEVPAEEPTDSEEAPAQGEPFEEEPAEEAPVEEEPAEEAPVEE
ncbi:MAG: hypothetical protein ACTHWA_02555, partial [Arachnia sp.]